jgi:hypothetical protein
MRYRRKVLVEQVPLVDNFVRHLVHHRAILAALRQYAIRSHFWTDTCNAHLLQALLYWCMVFGNDKSNKTHWKHVAPPGTLGSCKPPFVEGCTKH